MGELRRQGGLNTGAGGGGITGGSSLQFCYKGGPNLYLDQRQTFGQKTAGGEVGSDTPISDTFSVREFDRYPGTDTFSVGNLMDNGTVLVQAGTNTFPPLFFLIRNLLSSWYAPRHKLTHIL